MRRAVIFILYFISIYSLKAQELYLKTIIRPCENLRLFISSLDGFQEIVIEDKNNELCFIKQVENKVWFSFLDYENNTLQNFEYKTINKNSVYEESMFYYQKFIDETYYFEEENFITYSYHPYKSEKLYRKIKIDLCNKKIENNVIDKINKSSNNYNNSENVFFGEYVLENTDSWDSSDTNIVGYDLVKFRELPLPNIYSAKENSNRNKNIPYHGVIKENDEYLIILANILQEDVYLDNLDLIKEPHQKNWKSRKNDFDYVCLIYSKKTPPVDDKISVYTFYDSKNPYPYYPFYKDRETPYSKEEIINPNMNLTADSTFGEVINLSSITLYKEPDINSEKKLYETKEYPNHGIVLSLFTDSNGKRWKKMMDDDATVWYIPIK